MRLSILNVSAPTNVAESESKNNNTFYSALNKAKEQLDGNPSHKVVVLSDFNATISSKSKDCGSWDTALGHNNSDMVGKYDNGGCLNGA